MADTSMSIQWRTDTATKSRGEHDGGIIRRAWSERARSESGAKEISRSFLAGVEVPDVDTVKLPTPPVIPH